MGDARLTRRTLRCQNLARRNGTVHQRLSGRNLARVIALFICVWIIVAPVGADDEAVREAIRVHIEQLMFTEEMTVAGEALAAVELLPAFYERRGLHAGPGPRPRTSTSSSRRSRRSTFRVSTRMTTSSTICSACVAISRREKIRSGRADFDILLTEALARLAYHLRFGKVNPEKLGPQLEPEPQHRES